MWKYRETLELIRLATGFDLGTVGGHSLVRALKERMARCGVEDECGYLELVKHSPKELEELIEFLVVPETWFFRDEKPFTVLQKYVREEWLPTRPAHPIRIISLPCSTGEEPYTIAMALLDIGLDPEQWRIDAVDISRTALEKARRAVYGANSFRGNNLAFRERHFRPTGNGYALSETARKNVFFSQGNLFAKGFAVGKLPYHALFFRNLLIYLAPMQQDEAFAVIDRLLIPNGLLFVGHAESLQPLNRGYVPVRVPYGFAYRKPAGTGAGKADSPVSAVKPRTGKPVTTVVVKPPAANSGANAPAKPAAAQDPLAAAFALADRGQVNEARQLCESVLAAQPHKADAHYLLGLLLESQGRTGEAESCLQKAVYLQPDHVGALAHLALAAEWRGDAKAAELLRLRARRAESKQRGC